MSHTKFAEYECAINRRLVRTLWILIYLLVCMTRALILWLNFGLEWKISNLAKTNILYGCIKIVFFTTLPFCRKNIHMQTTSIRESKNTLCSINSVSSIVDDRTSRVFQLKNTKRNQLVPAKTYRSVNGNFSFLTELKIKLEREQKVKYYIIHTRPRSLIWIRNKRLFSIFFYKEGCNKSNVWYFSVRKMFNH